MACSKILHHEVDFIHFYQNFKNFCRLIDDDSPWNCILERNVEQKAVQKNVARMIAGPFPNNLCARYIAISVASCVKLILKAKWKGTDQGCNYDDPQ